MSFALESVKQIQAVYKEMVDTKKTLCEEQSKYDKRLSELYHEIETAGDVDMVEAFEYFKTLQVTLQTRRRVKHELAALQVATKEMSEAIDSFNRVKQCLENRKTENDRYTKSFTA